MNTSLFSDITNFDEEVMFCLEYQMIPTWKEYGVNRLVVSEKTLQEFQAQPLPQDIHALPKMRKHKKGVRSRRNIKNLSVEIWPEDNLHTMISPSLVYVRSGMMEVQLGDYVAQYPSRHFLLLRPEVPYPARKKPWLIEPYENKSCEIWRFTSAGYNDYISLSISRSVEDRHANSGQFYIVSTTPIAQLFHLFTQDALNKPAEYSQTVPSLLHSFLWLFLRKIKAGHFYNRGVADLTELTSTNSSPIEIAKQYIDDNLNHKLTIDNVSKVIFMSRAAFTSTFRKETGKTFNQYLTERRLEEAKHWLTRKSCSIPTVCKYVGLKNTQFHQLFKEHFGITPAEFRRIQNLSETELK